MAHRRERTPWQPSEGSRLWGYLLPMLIALPAAFFWIPILFSLSWESGVLLGGVVTFVVTAVAWVLFVRSTEAESGR